MKIKTEFKGNNIPYTQQVGSNDLINGKCKLVISI